MPRARSIILDLIDVGVVGRLKCYEIRLSPNCSSQRRLMILPFRGTSRIVNHVKNCDVKKNITLLT